MQSRSISKGSSCPFSINCAFAQFVQIHILLGLSYKMIHIPAISFPYFVIETARYLSPN